MRLDRSPQIAGATSFSEPIIATAADIDELGHVSNLATLRWVQEIAKSHSRAVGWDFPAYLALGAVFVVRRHELDYLTPALLGDELNLTTWITAWTGATSERRTRIVRASDGREIGRALTLWALVSRDSGRPRRVPAELREAFGTTAASVS